MELFLLVIGETFVVFALSLIVASASEDGGAVERVASTIFMLTIPILVVGFLLAPILLYLSTTS